MPRRPASRNIVAVIATVLLAVGAPFAATPARAADSSPSANPAATNPAATNPSPTNPPSTATAGVTIRVNSVTPRAPDPAPSTEKVTFTATITNNTDVSYGAVQVELQRGQPILGARTLQDVIATPLAAVATDNIYPAPLALSGPLAAHGHLLFSYVTTPEAGNMCLCATGVDPFALVVKAATSPDGSLVELARTQVLVPTFLTKPAPVDVAWVWPLIDGPHRTLSDTVFTDDSLATSVSRDGRLERALRTAELATAAGVRMTLLVDPELLDSLAVMASGYQLKNGNVTVPGTGGPAAKAWLDRFASLRSQQDVSLTAYADPDVDAISRAGLSYSTALDPQVQSRLQPIVGNYFPSDLYWPIGGVLTSAGLNAAVAAGASSIILSDAALPAPEGNANALAGLPSSSGQANALVTNPGIEASIGDAITNPAGVATDEQNLLAQLAVQAAADQTAANQPAANQAARHFFVLTPGRYVDADPGTAAAFMQSITQTSWLSSVRIRDALRSIPPVNRGALVTAASNQAGELTQSQLAHLSQLTGDVLALRTAFSASEALLLLGNVNAAVQRAQSNYWRREPAGLNTVINLLQQQNAAIADSVHLVQPTNGTYSLSSQDSPVVVTVENTLAQPVTVAISVQATRGVLGFRASPLGHQTIQGHTKTTVTIPTHTDRLGRFTVIANLSTPDGHQLGASIPLTLRVTAIGGITKAITGFAGVILALALIRRLYRRLRPGKRAPRA